MMPDAQLAKGDICGDPTALRVRVEDVDIYDYVHFSVIERSDSGEDEAGSKTDVPCGFRSSTKLGNMFANRRAA
jgi:hypothetical protein